MNNEQPDRIDVGKRIHQARNSKGLSLQELGTLSNTKKSTLNSYERGLALPKETLITRLAILLDASADYLKWGSQQLNCSYNTTNEVDLCMECATHTHAQLVDAYTLLKASKFTFNPVAKETMLLQIQEEINHIKAMFLGKR